MWDVGNGHNPEGKPLPLQAAWPDFDWAAFLQTLFPGNDTLDAGCILLLPEKICGEAGRSLRARPAGPWAQALNDHLQSEA